MREVSRRSFLSIIPVYAAVALLAACGGETTVTPSHENAPVNPSISPSKKPTAETVNNTPPTQIEATQIPSVFITDTQGNTIELPNPNGVITRESSFGPVAWSNMPDFPERLMTFLPTIVGGTGYYEHGVDDNGSIIYSANTVSIFHAPTITISVDGRMNSDVINRMMDIAHEHGWPMSFYLNGNLQDEKNTFLRILTEGHEVGYFPSTGVPLGWNESVNWLVSDALQFQSTVRDVTGIKYDIRTIRVPHLNVQQFNPTRDEVDETLKQFVAENGLIAILRNYVPGIRQSITEMYAQNTQTEHPHQTIIDLPPTEGALTWLKENALALQALREQGVIFVNAFDSLLVNGNKHI